MVKKNIVIVGAGFGGVTAALRLARKVKAFRNEYKIILIDRHHHQLYTPALYEIAAILRRNISDIALKSAVLIPITDIIDGKPIEFLSDELTGINTASRNIILKNSGAFPYEYLILALGSETNYFDISGLKEYSLPLKTFDDATRLRNTIENYFIKNGSLKIAVGGGGSTGVELVAEFINFICLLQERLKKNHHACSVEFILLEASPEILPGFETWIIKKTKKRLAEMGVKIKTNTAVAAVTAKNIILKDGSNESYDILIWTGGVKGPAILAEWSLPLSNKGSLIINEYLKVSSDNEHIFAIGDNSAFTHPRTGKALVWNVPVAEAEGRLAAENISRIIRGKPLQKFSPMKKYPFILAVGKKYAIADLIYIRFSGITGWLAKLLVELRYLLFILPFKKAMRTWWLSVKIYSSND